MNKINLYIFSQILKSCTLVFFIFVSIAWLLQLSRLFHALSQLKINSLEIMNLSFLIIPNLTNVILPFLVIFGLVLSFIKLSRDKEIIAIFSLGLSVEEIRKPIFLLITFLIILSIMLSFIFSPKTYAIYKEKEFNLRNTIQFDKVDFSNFIKFSNNLIIDFENNNGKFENILINITDDNETIIFGESGQIDQTNKEISFKLFNGFKTQIKKDGIDNLNFDTYIASFPIEDKNIYKKNDPNALDIFELINIKNQKNISIIYLRIIDILIIVSLTLFFYINIIKSNRFDLPNQLFFVTVGIYCLLIDNLLENFSFQNNIIKFILFFNLIIIHFFPIIMKLPKFKHEK